MTADTSRASFAPWLLFSTLLLLPFGVGAELPILIGSVLGLVQIGRGQITWERPAVRVALWLGVAYWLPECLSALDSVAIKKSSVEVLADLRFIPFLIYLAQAGEESTDSQRRALTIGLAAIIGFWCLDALVQAGTGFSLGGSNQTDRLSGIFGDGNLKLGGVLAVLSPLLLVETWRRWGVAALAASCGVLLVVILLAGARAAWVGFAVGTALVFWQVLGRRRALAAMLTLLLLGSVAGVVGYVSSERFAARVDRTAAALAGEPEALDHALSGRLAIWQTAWEMGKAHPVNGVGVRAFRYAYPQYAKADDSFVEGDTGAFHAHQWLLELWSETGSLGLLIWLFAVVHAYRQYQRLSLPARANALPVGIALLVALFPINTHYAVYSGFWGAFLMWLLGLWLWHWGCGESTADAGSQS